MQDTPMIGRTVSHYKIVERLGQGGMGVVYKARDLSLDRFVALKFLSRSIDAGGDAKLRFVREAKAASALDHAHICTIYGIEEADDHVFIVMACYDGETLRQRLTRGPLPVEEAVHITIQVADGLAKAHAHGIVHRDVKPANIILTTDKVVKILDFGLAMLADNVRATRPGTVMGTVAYMSPEQARGRGVDHRTDIWSLGVVLFEMLTGQPPFRSQFDQAVVYSILNDQAATVTTVRPSASSDLDGIVSRAMAKDPGSRYQSAKEISADLRAAIGLPQRPDTGPAMAPSLGPVPDVGLSDAPTEGRRPPSIAVMPFANLTRDEENEYFSDGLTEDLITALAQLDGLKVVSRTSAFQFKGQAQDVRRIGEQLNVTNVLEGSIRRSGDRLRITAQLVNAADGYQIWSERFDREMSDVFAIQDEIAHSIVGALKIKLKGEPQTPLVRRPTDSLEAYHLYLKGRYHFNKQTEGGFSKAREYFEQAIVADPDYAAAHAGLAEYYMGLGFWSVLPPAEVWPKAKSAELRALELSADLAEVHISLGYVRIFCDWDWHEAETEFRCALDLRPGHANAHYAQAIFLFQMARFEESVVEMTRALELDPLSTFVNSGLAWAHFYARHYERAIEQVRKTLELDPNCFEAQLIQGMASEQEGMRAEAISIFEHLRVLSGGNPLIVGLLGSACAMSGQTDRAVELLGALGEMARERYVTPIAQALVHIGLGDHDRAFESLGQAAENRDALLCYLNVLPAYDPLRSDPRFADLQRKIGLS